VDYYSNDVFDLERTWEANQVRSKAHVTALVIFGILSVLPLSVVVITLAVMTIYIAIKRMPGMLVMAAFVSLVTLIFPPLAGLLAIVFFFMKISYIIKHFRPMLLGLSSIVYLIYSSFQTYDLFYYYYGGYDLFLLLGRVLFSAGLFHIILYYLYRHEYSTQEAVSIMAAVPLFLIMLVLPFVIRQIEGMINDYNSVQYYHYQQAQYQQSDQYQPGIHSVRGHYRENSDGSASYVRPHIRTNPDGIESNNLSSGE